MNKAGGFLVFLALFDCILSGSASELIFYLNNGDEQCFYEHVEMNSWVRLNYYVLRGGDFRVGATLRGPDGRALYDRPHEAFDSGAFTVAQSGVYSLCFYNARAISSAKFVSFELDVTAPAQIAAAARADEGEQVDEASLLERLYTISTALDAVASSQSFLRHRESVDAARAADVNMSVTRWAVAQSAAIIAVGAAQLLVIRRPFELSARPRI